MKNVSRAPLSVGSNQNEKARLMRMRGLGRTLALSSVLVGALLLSGCETAPESSNNSAAAAAAAENSQKPTALTLQEGDQVRISFPGSPTLDSTQSIRRDGKLALALIGEIQAAGLSPTQLQDELLKKYGSQLVSKEVTVTVVSANISTFVSGAVLKPGKIISDHPMTVLEAIMEAGGPDYTKANLKTVSIIRQNADGKTQKFTVNVKLLLEGKDNTPFYLRPSDIVFVPERFSMY